MENFNGLKKQLYRLSLGSSRAAALSSWPTTRPYHRRHVKNSHTKVRGWLGEERASESECVCVSLAGRIPLVAPRVPCIDPHTHTHTHTRHVSEWASVCVRAREQRWAKERNRGMLGVVFKAASFYNDCAAAASEQRERRRCTLFAKITPAVNPCNWIAA
jgi:hypothetical protein